MLSCLKSFVPLVESLPDGPDDGHVVLDQVEQVVSVSLGLVPVHLLHLLLHPGQVAQNPGQAVGLLHAGQRGCRLRERRGGVGEVVPAC